MTALKLIGWGAICAGAILALVTFAARDLIFVAPAIMAVVSGTLFLAKTPTGDHQKASPDPDMPAPSMEDIERRIEAAKKR